MRRILSLAVALSMVLMCAACSGGSSSSSGNPNNTSTPTQAAAQGGGEIIMTIGSGGTGGVFYPIAAAMTSIINANVDGVRVNNESTGGSSDNSRMIGEHEIEMGMSAGDICYFAYNGIEDFDGNQMDNVLSLFAMYPSVASWTVTEASGIETLDDLAGRKLAIGMAGSGTENSARFMLPLLGIDYPDGFEPMYIDANESADAMRDGLCDGMHGFGGNPQGALLELSQTVPLRCLQFPDEYIEKVIAERPYYYKCVMPANTYIGQDYDVDTYGVNTLMLIDADVDEELAYQITKALWENVDILMESHANMSYMTEDFVCTGLTVPLHPGAERYWKEVGILK